MLVGPSTDLDNVDTVTTNTADCQAHFSYVEVFILIFI